MRMGTYRHLSGRAKAWGGTAVLSCALLLLGPAVMRAQDKQGGAEKGQAEKSGGNTALNDKHVSLNVEQQSMLEAVKTLMKSVQADYVIDNALKEASVTLHLEDVRFEIALKTLLKVSTLPVAYHVDSDGVYHFEPGKEAEAPDTPALPAAPPEKRGRVEKIPVKNTNAEETARRLRGEPEDETPNILYGTGSVGGFISGTGGTYINGRYYPYNTNSNPKYSDVKGNTLGNLFNMLGSAFLNRGRGNTGGIRIGNGGGR